MYVALGLMMASTQGWPFINVEDGGMVGDVCFPWGSSPISSAFPGKKDVWGVSPLSPGMASQI